MIDKWREPADKIPTFFIDMGDGCDMIVSQGGDRRFKPSMVDPRYLNIDCPVDVMIADYVEMLKPISGRLLAMCDSNHHLTITDRTGTNPTRRIGFTLWDAKEAERRLLGYAGFLVTTFSHNGNKGSKVRQIVWNLCHGISAGGKTEGGAKTTIGNDASYYLADVHCYAHNHQLDGWDRIQIGVDRFGEKIKSRKIVRLNTGSFLKGMSDNADTSYAERARYKPNSIGYMEVLIHLTDNGENILYTKHMIL